MKISRKTSQGPEPRKVQDLKAGIVFVLDRDSEYVHQFVENRIKNRTTLCLVYRAGGHNVPSLVCTQEVSGDRPAFEIHDVEFIFGTPEVVV